VGLFKVESGWVGVRVTEHGVVQQIISDCAPRLNQTCSFFAIFVLRTNDGKTYILLNFPMSMGNEWKNKQVSITGFLVTPSRSGFNFVDGDLYVETLTG
jgi:hypothetical protein